MGKARARARTHTQTYTRASPHARARAGAQVYGSSYKFNHFLSLSTKEAVKLIRDLPDDLLGAGQHPSLCRPDKLRELCGLLRRAWDVSEREAWLAAAQWRETWPKNLRFRAGRDDPDACRDSGPRVRARPSGPPGHRGPLLLAGRAQPAAVVAVRRAAAEHVQRVHLRLAVLLAAAGVLLRLGRPRPPGRRRAGTGGHREPPVRAAPTRHPPAPPPPHSPPQRARCN